MKYEEAKHLKAITRDDSQKLYLAALQGGQITVATADGDVIDTLDRFAKHWLALSETKVD